MMGYTEKVELKMQRLFERLSEKDRRCYAAIEATKFSHGGTVHNRSENSAPRTRRIRIARRPRAQSGEKKGRMQLCNRPKCNAGGDNLTVLADFTAGDPMREGVLWTTNHSVKSVENWLKWERLPVGTRCASY